MKGVHISAHLFCILYNLKRVLILACNLNKALINMLKKAFNIGVLAWVHTSM